MGAALFYHLTRSPAEAVAASLLERALAAGWRVELRSPDAERRAALDARLWLGAEDGFLPHGIAGGPNDRLQPVLLTLPGEAAGNVPQALMSVDGAPVGADEVAARDRVWLLFDGADLAAVDHARAQWKTLTGAGLAAQYWSEESGRWQMKLERAAAL